MLDTSGRNGNSRRSPREYVCYELLNVARRVADERERDSFPILRVYLCSDTQPGRGMYKRIERLTLKGHADWQSASCRVVFHVKSVWTLRRPPSIVSHGYRSALEYSLIARNLIKTAGAYRNLHVWCSFCTGESPASTTRNDRGWQRIVGEEKSREGKSRYSRDATQMGKLLNSSGYLVFVLLPSPPLVADSYARFAPPFAPSIDVFPCRSTFPASTTAFPV